MRFFLVALLVVSMPALGSPFLVSDPTTEPAVDQCVYQDGVAAPVATPLVNGGCRIDLGPFSGGNHNLQVWFRSTLWGVDSAKIPFAALKPQAGGAGPAGLRIEP